MQDKNGYFEIVNGDDSVTMRCYPPTGGGQPLKVEDVSNFLDRVGVKNYDIITINNLISRDDICEEIISNETCFSFDESMEIMVTADKMQGIARFYPCSSDGSRMSKDEIIRTLNQGGIRYGILDKAIDNFIENPEYCKNILIAKGTNPTEGTDATIEYFFKTDKNAKPQLNEDGTVDFHHLNNISNVKVGQVLAALTPENPGVPGTSVLGEIVNPPKVKKLSLKYGKYIKISEDKLKIISEVDGHATLENEKVFVSNNYDVPADVDNSTGDISYNGSVTVKGNVRTGFSVEADGDVEVFGVVEGAKIVAGGNIILHRGIQGMGKSEIRTKGNIISKFIESADVIVDGYIETDTILNSNVSAKGDIYVRGKNASLIGGNVRSTTLIEAAVIGSPMGTSTSVEVGTDPAVRDRIKKLKESIENKKAENEKLQQILTVLRKKKDMGILEEEKLPMLSQLTKTILLNTTEINDAKEEMESTEKLLQENENARIRATKSIHQGTKVTVAGDYIYIHKEVIHSEFMRHRSEIKVVPL